MKNAKTAKLFMSGKSQAVRLPKLFRMDGHSAHIARVGSSLVLSPIKLDRWTVMEEALNAFEFEPGFVLARPETISAVRPELFP